MYAQLPINHFNHLNRLMSLRRCPMEEALDYLMTHVAPSDKDHLTAYHGASDEVRRVDIRHYDIDEVIARIQGLPRNIRPVTDGPYLESFAFLPADGDLIGIEAEGVTIYDYFRATTRDERVFALVRDLLPKMTVEQYRLYNTFNSQYLWLVREPELSTMPRRAGIAIDAGCYIGYKAFALAQFTDGAPVLCFELLPEIYSVLERNVRLNPSLDVRPYCCALSDKRQSMPAFTRDEKSMANSLTSFAGLAEKNTSLSGSTAVDRDIQYVTTELLDDYTKDFSEVSCLHISVNGYEPEVLGGGLDTAKRADIIRISAPYHRDGLPVRDAVVQRLRDAKIRIFGVSGAAVIAGSKLGPCHAVPLDSKAGMGMARLGMFHIRRRLRRALGRQ